MIVFHYAVVDCLGYDKHLSGSEPIRNGTFVQHSQRIDTLDTSQGAGSYIKECLPAIGYCPCCHIALLF